MAFIFTNTNITSIKQKAFNCCGVLDIYFDESKIETFESHSDYDNRCNFGYCRNLRTVSFKNCHNLTNIGNNISAYAGFALSPNLESIDFTGCENLTQLTMWVGSSCSSLKSVNFNGCTSLQYIGKECFSNANLQNLDLTPCTSLIQVNASAFKGNHELKTVNASNLTNLKVFSSGSDYQTGALMDCPLLESIDFHGCTALTNFGGTHTCYNDKSLQSVNFEGCSSLEKFNESIFADCSALTSLNITGCTSLTSFEKTALVRCGALESITGWNDIKTNVQYFKESSFEDCIVLNVDLSNLPSLVSFGNKCFYRDVALDSTMEECPSLVTIGDSAFNGCTSLGDIDLHNNTSLTTIGNSAFQSAKAVHVNLNNCSALTSIGQKAWYGSKTEEFYMNDCTALTTINGSNNNGAWEAAGQLRIFEAERCMLLTSVPHSAFRSCSALSRCSFKDCSSITIIDTLSLLNSGNCDYDFSGCTSLIKLNYSCAGSSGGGGKFKTLLLKDCPIQIIGDSAFRRTVVGQVTTNDLPSDTTITGYVDFSNCTTLEIIDNDAFNTSGINHVDISNCNNLNSIKTRAFANNVFKYLNVDNTNNITEIGDGAFLPNSNSWAPVIEKYADFVVPKLTTIGSSAFSYNNAQPGCGCIRSFNASGSPIATIPNHVFSRSSCVIVDFSNCINLTTIGNNNCFNMSKLESIDFSGCTNLQTIGSTMCGLKNASCPNLTMVSFKNCSALKNISINGYYDCKALEVFDVTGCVLLETIDHEAFFNCSKMQLVGTEDLPLKEIQYSAFAHCKEIASLKFASSKLTDVGSEAFTDCPMLTEIELHFDDSTPNAIHCQAFSGLGTNAGGATVKIYAETPPSVDAIGDPDTTTTSTGNTWRIASNTSSSSTFHFNTSAETSYKEAAKLLEESSRVTKKDGSTFINNCIAWWCCSNGATSTTTGGLDGSKEANTWVWYTGYPSIMFDL